MGLKTFDRNGNVNFDTTSATWVQVAILDIGAGDISQTVTFSGANLPAGMEIRAASLIVNNIPAGHKQLVPSITVDNTNDASRSVTIQTTSGTATNSEGETVTSFSAPCKIIILGR